MQTYEDPDTRTLPTHFSKEINKTYLGNPCMFLYAVCVLHRIFYLHVIVSVIQILG
jgi:hypothetical protein